MEDYGRQLRPASLRGVPFMVEGDDTSFGRRVITHEFPGRDDPGHEDLGASPRGLSIDAIIGGSGFMAAAAALEAALEQPGPAILIHPHYGEVTVIVKAATRRHSSSAVGEIRFSITMERYGAVQFPSAASNTAAGLASASAAGFAAAVADFNQFFRVSGLPDFVTLDGTTRHGVFMDGLKGLLNGGGINHVLPVLDVFTGGFAGSVAGFYQDLMALVAPRKRPVIGRVDTSARPAPRHLVNALMLAADQSLVDSVPATTANRSARAGNAQSLDFLHRISSLGAGVGAVRYIAFESREEAIATRDGLNGRLATLRDQMGAEGWDQSWRAATAMQAALNRDINAQIGRLPKTVRIRPASVRSSLALANRLYGDNPAALTARAADLARRNAVRHPGFVPANELEVLIDAT